MNDSRMEKPPMPLTWKTALCSLAAAMAFIRCDMQMAGTSVGTGNPTEIEVAFKNDSGSVPITGTLEVYASTQIPVPGFAPAPLLSVSVSGETQARLTADEFKSIVDSLWPKTSVENETYHFNVVVKGEDHGAILKGWVFRKKEGDFLLRTEDSTASRNDNVATVQGVVTPLVEYKGALDPTKLSPYWDYFLFLDGTGYASKGDNGKFSIPKLPLGQYESHVVLLPGKDPLLGGTDSTTVYGLTTLIEPGKESLTLSTEQKQIPLPDSLKVKSP